MNKIEARKLIEGLTYEEKLELLAFIKQLKADRK